MGSTPLTLSSRKAGGSILCNQSLVYIIVIRVYIITYNIIMLIRRKNNKFHNLKQIPNNYFN